MRLWHTDLLDVLPKQQLISQYRECCLIAYQITNHGTPNHVLVNKIMNYPLGHFYRYTLLVRDEMIRRGYKCSIEKFSARCPDGWSYQTREYTRDNIFISWHDFRYLRECLYNLEEKAMCGAISLDEWMKIYERYNTVVQLWDGTD